MIASEAGEGSGGARSANTVAQSAVGRRVAHTIDFPDTIGVREVRTHVLIFSVAIFTHGDLFSVQGRAVFAFTFRRVCCDRRSYMRLYTDK